MNNDQEKFINEYLSTNEGAFACNLCQSFKRSDPYPVRRHIRQVHFWHSVKFNGNKFWSNCNVPICKKWCTSNKRGHYHCFHCTKIFSEKARLVAHFQKLSDEKSVDTAVIASVKTDAELVNIPKKVTELTTEDKSYQHMQPSETKKKSSNGTGDKINCVTCHKLILKKNIKKHYTLHVPNERCVSKEWHHRGSCFDREQGLYLVSENMSGVQHPIHVQKLIVPGRTPILFCESKKCQDSFNAHGIAGIGHFECDHLLSTQFLNCTEPIELDTCVQPHSCQIGKYSVTEMANMRCTVKFFLDQITCPGTLHLPDRNPVFLSIYLFGRPQKSSYVYPSFPMSFCAKIKYQRLFTNAKTPEQLLEILEDETILIELRQHVKGLKGGRVLAVFEENTRNFLFPTPSIIPERNLVKRDILLTRTDNFPILKGLDPQFTFRTKTYIEEGPFVHLNDDNDEPIPVTRQLPSSVSPKKNKSPARSISLLDIDYEDENELDDSSSPTKGTHCICDCPVLDKDPEAIDQWLNGLNLNKGKTNEKKPFLTGKAPKQLISRRVFDESPEKEKKYTGKGICNSCAIPLPTCVLCNAYKTVYGTNSFLAHRFNRKPKKNKKKRLKKKRVNSRAKTPSPVKSGKRNLNSSYDASKYINTSLVGNRTVDASVRTSDGNLRPMKEKSNSEYLVSKYSCDDSDVESLDGTSKLVLPPRSSTRASNAKALFMEERPKSVPPKSKPERPRLFNPPPVQRSLSEDELESARIHKRIKNLMKKNNSELQYDLSSSDSLTDEEVKSDTNEDVLSESSDDDGLPIYLKTKKNLPTKSFVEPVESSKKWSSSSAVDGLTYRERLDNRLKAIYADLYQKTLNNE